ncbi:recombinase family protein [Pseudofrankia sp. BMG5.37]|uniref:recombinase family protein n=1 Tax=Pseudofrankia sp. BMG5.37 TaxID=3050035 RepID=UPI0028947E61|nr:recombinase family protein [Pseudofrankia sp. BMG5.37]MDT3438365.1 recombinase family protein [Pseudofrankia sp. BMG5.37]
MGDDPEPALNYGRISDDPLGIDKGVDGQLADGRALAPRYALRIVQEFRDDDISALRGAHRPGYEALVAAISAGTAKVIIVYQTSRLWRNREERAAAIGLFGRHGVRIIATKGPHLDLSTASGRGLTGLLGEFDTMESEIKSERVTSEAARRAAEGRANGMVAYGWAREYLTDDRGRRVGWQDVEHPEQAGTVRWIVDRLLAGVSLKAVTADLNAREVVAPGGKAWLPSGVRKVALRPANVARRIYRGEDVGPAAWPAIVDPADHAQVVALLGDPGRVTSRSGARRHMLTYAAEIAVCGACGAELRVGKVGRYVLYQCIKGCVGRNQARVDDLVDLVVIERFSRPDAAALFVRNDDGARAAQKELARLRAKLATATDDYNADLIDREQFIRITADLRPKIEKAEAEARRTVPGVGAEVIRRLIDDPEVTWLDIDDQAQRHAVLRSIGLFVRILSTRQGKGFDPRSVEVTWPEDRARP